MQIEGKHILVVGAARSGLAAAEFLAARGAAVTVNDAKPVAEWPDGGASLQARGIVAAGGAHPIELFESADLIVVSPGVPLALGVFARARAAGVPILGEAELAARFLRGRIVGITGSNGKTTTTTLIGELLANAGLPTLVGGNIGTALISLVEASREDGFIVAEMSSFQLEAVETFHAFVALHLNLTPDHLDRYPSIEAYGEAKANLFRNQTAADVAVLNADNEWSARMRERTPARVFWFSRLRALTGGEEGVFLRGEDIVFRQAGREERLLGREDIRLPGLHNVENVMAALAAGLACGASIASMRETVRQFKGVEHRLEFAGEIDGVKFYNDSKATNVDAAIKCIEAFDRGVIVILGGKDKGSDYAPLAPLVRERCEHVILIGAAADKIAAALPDTRPLHRAATMGDAVRLGRTLGRPGDIVLLAPACASFDMFDNYEHRGRVFKEEVKRMMNDG